MPLRDQDALSAATAELLADPERREALGQAGRSRVEALFTEERFYGQLEELYQRLVTRYRPS